MWEGVRDRTELQHIDPHSYGHNRFSFPFSWAAQPGAWGPTLLGAGFLSRILSPTGLVSNLIDFLFSPSYIIVQCPPSCGCHNRTHSIHPQSRLYSDIPCTDAPVIYIGAFPILTARPGCKSIYNIFYWSQNIKLAISDFFLNLYWLSRIDIKWILILFIYTCWHLKNVKTKFILCLVGGA